jgi:hypothetical protein
LLQLDADTPAKRVLATLASGLGGMIVLKEPADIDLPGPLGGFLLVRPGAVRDIAPSYIETAVRGILIGQIMMGGDSLPTPRILRRRTAKMVKEIAKLLQSRHNPHPRPMTGGRERTTMMPYRFELLASAATRYECKNCMV